VVLQSLPTTRTKSWCLTIISQIIFVSYSRGTWIMHSRRLLNWKTSAIIHVTVQTRDLVIMAMLADGHSLFVNSRFTLLEGTTTLSQHLRWWRTAWEITWRILTGSCEMESAAVPSAVTWHRCGSKTATQFQRPACSYMMRYLAGFLGKTIPSFQLIKSER
jgi:hypothetical protein